MAWASFDQTAFAHPVESLLCCHLCCCCWQAEAVPLPEHVPVEDTAAGITYDLWAAHDTSGVTDLSKV